MIILIEKNLPAELSNGSGKGYSSELIVKFMLNLFSRDKLNLFF